MPYQNILLIDDDEDDQQIFLKVLYSLTRVNKCSVFGDADDAFEKLAAREVDADLIFLNLNMPVMSGQGFLGALKESEDLKHIPVIILSDSAHPDMAREIKSLGALEFIRKPGKFSELKNILHSILG